MVRRGSPVRVRHWALLRQQHLDDLAHGMVTLERVPERHVRLDLVLVATAHPPAHHVALVGEIGDYPLSRAFGDAHTFGDVADADVGLLCDADEYVRMISQEGPTHPRVAKD